MHISGFACMIPTPSDQMLVKLASIAAQIEGVLASENPLNKERIGLRTVKNDRRRSMESILMLLADTEVQKYLAEAERLGLLPPKG
jgi:hypothetical protein